MRSQILLGLTAGLFASFLVSSCVSPDTPEPPRDAEPKTAVQPIPKPQPASIPRDAAIPADAPAVFKVQFKTSVGDIVLECHRDWAPKGADRFFELVKKGFYNDIAFFRVIPNFMAQFGIHGDPEEAGEWRGQRIADDPVRQSNTRGTVSFATSGPNTRTTQMFINFKNNGNLDGMGFAPFAKVVAGLDVVDKIYKVGEGAPRGSGPSQSEIQAAGNKYLKTNFPKLTYIRGAVYLGASK